MTNRLKNYVQNAERSSAPAPTKGSKLVLINSALAAILVIGALAMFLPRPDGNTASENTPDASAPATSEQSTPASAPVSKLPDEADALITQFRQLAQPCDAAGDAVKTAMQAPGTAPDELYSAAKAAEGICQQSFLDIANKLRPPPSADEATAKRFDVVLDMCQKAYDGKKHTSEALAAAVDGGMIPSKVAEYKRYAAATDAALGECVPGLMLEVQKAGGKASGLDAKPTGAANAD